MFELWNRWVASASLRRLAWGVGALLAALLAARQLYGVSYVYAQDSWFAMQKAVQYLASGHAADLYQTLLFDQHIKFQYPPTGLLLLELLHVFGWQGAWVYNFINGIALAVTALVFAWWAQRTLPTWRVLGVRVPVELLAFMLVFKFYPNHLALVIGQIQVMLNLLFLLACIAYSQQRTSVAGVLVAVIASVKPQFAVFGLLALWQRDRAFVYGFFITGLALLAISLALYGVQVHVAYVRDVLPYLSRHGECFHLNQSINGVANRSLMTIPCVDVDPNVAPDSIIKSSWFPPYNAFVYVLSTVTTVLMLAWPFWLSARAALTDERRSLLFASAGLLFTMAAPIAWVHHYGVMLPVYVLLIPALLKSAASQRHQQTLAIGVALSLLLCALAWAAPFAPTLSQPNWLQSHVLIGAVLLVAVLTVIIRGRSDRVGATQ